MAITFGNTSFGASGSSHNNNGDYLDCFVSSTSNDVTAVTYNSVGMTQIGSSVDNSTSGRFVSAWRLVAPTAGSNNITITGGANLGTRRQSYSGVHQTTPVSGQTTSGGTSTTPAVSVTTTVNNAYVIAMGFIRDFSSVGANTTVLNAGDDANFSVYRSTSAVAVAGSLTINVNSTGSEWDFIAYGLNPLVTSYTMAADVGAYVLTGVDAGLGRLFTLVASVGSYILTGMDALLTSSGWVNQSKNNSSYNNQYKNSSSTSNQSKNTSSWIDLNKS